MKVGIVISTYNNPFALERTLYGYLCQNRKADEIVIADDGSGEETRALIERYAKKLPIKHIWHEDNGFRKTTILNKALVAAESEYLIFTDQDCIPRQDFIETHLKYARKGYILSGGYFKLPMSISQALTFDDIKSGNAFSYKWLRKNGLKTSFKCAKLLRYQAFRIFMNHITTAKATWNGCNSSGWRSDMLRVNGYNEQMQYGGEDREFGERLFNLGIKSKQIRYSAIIVHLDHKRPYKTEEVMKKNNQIRKETRLNRIIETPYGIKKLKGNF